MAWTALWGAPTLLGAAGHNSQTVQMRPSPAARRGNYAQSRSDRCRCDPSAGPSRRGGHLGHLPGGRAQHPQGHDPHLRRGVQPLHANRRQQRPRPPTPPFTLGDELVFHDQLFANGKRVGDDLGSCVIASFTTQELAANCSLVIRLPDGNLTGQFIAVQGPAPREIALTGGTGRYRSAGGEGSLVEFGNGKGRMTLQALSL
ncbi:MAG: allene oxide cyclase barrel-like domain-containing protein, partial [Actinomycetes bacterium]